MSCAKCFSFPPGVAFQQLGDDQDGVMMSLTSGYLYRCNRTATIVLAAIAAGKTADDAAAELAKKFDIELQSARRDVDALVDSLCKRQLVREAA